MNILEVWAEAKDEQNIRMASHKGIQYIKGAKSFLDTLSHIKYDFGELVLFNTDWEIVKEKKKVVIAEIKFQPSKTDGLTFTPCFKNYFPHAINPLIPLNKPMKMTLEWEE